MPDKSSESFRQTIRDLQDLFCQAMELRNKAEITRSALAWDKLAAKTLGTIIRLKFAWFRQELPMRNLHIVSKYCLGIIRVNIDDLGISRDADSFRAKLEDSDFTSFAFQDSFCASLSDPPYPFLTPRQWRVLAPLLPPPDPIRRRGRPSVDPRELLDAIFWKLAHKARWQDLPDYYPPMLSCRRYYRRLFLSGRLTTLYAALYQDLLARGEATLTQIVHQRFFTVTENMLTLPPGLNEIWQLRTALLFLQL
ncbi:MAG: transposase, partial [Thermoleophilia bacterium]